MARIVFDSKSAQVIVHRSDGKRLRGLFDALAEGDAFGVAISDHAASLADQLRDADVLVIASRIPPVVSEPYAKLLDRFFASRDTEPLAYQSDEIEALEFDTRIRGGEAPANGGLLDVAVVHTGSYFTNQRVFVGDAAVQALAAQHTQLDLGHV